MTESRQIRIPAELCTAAEEKFGKTFASVDELVVFLLRELLRGDTTALDQAEQRALEQRLKDLGYM